MDKTSQLKKAHLDEYKKLVREASDILNDEQYARFAAFEDHFRRQIKQRMGRRDRDQFMKQSRKAGKKGKKNKFKN